MALTFSEFAPRSLAFEVRYADAYLLWDRAGELTEGLRNLHEITRRTFAEPGKIAFIAESTTEVTWQLDRLMVIDHQPPASKPEGFFRLCADCMEMTVNILGVSQLTRVGFRPVFIRKFASKQEAAAALLSASLLHVPAGKNLNIDPVHTYPEYGIRCEDEKFGYMLRLSVQDVNYELEVNPQWRGNTVETKHEDFVVFDIDCYTRALLPVGSFQVVEWLQQLLHVIRRDADSYLVR